MVRPFSRQLGVDGRDDTVVDQGLADVGPLLVREGLEAGEVGGFVEVEAGLLSQHEHRRQHGGNHGDHESFLHCGGSFRPGIRAYH